MQGHLLVVFGSLVPAYINVAEVLHKLQQSVFKAHSFGGGNRASHQKALQLRCEIGSSDWDDCCQNNCELLLLRLPFCPWFLSGSVTWISFLLWSLRKRPAKPLRFPKRTVPKLQHNLWSKYGRALKCLTLEYSPQGQRVKTLTKPRHRPKPSSCINASVFFPPLCSKHYALSVLLLLFTWIAFKSFYLIPFFFHC